MGKTQYFCSCKKPTKEQKDLIIGSILDDNLTAAHRMISVIMDNVAFGELKDNNQFCFYCNGFKHYQPNEESINEYLSLEDRLIMSSNGQILTANDIWTLVEDSKDKENKQKDYQNLTEADKNFIDLVDIDIKQKSPWLKNFQIQNGEFYNDNLRFSAYC